MRLHRRVIYQAVAFVPVVAAAAVAPDPAFATTSQQVINRTIVYEESAYAPFTPAAAEVVTVDKWWRQVDVPVRRKSITAEEGSSFSAPPIPQANDAIGWHKPLDLPVRRRVVIAEEGSIFSSPPFPVVPWGWYEHLDRAHPIKRVPVGQISLQFVAAAPGAAVALNWFADGEPLRLKRNFQQLNDAYPPYQPPTAEIITVDKWWQQLDIPVRLRRVTSEEGSYFGSPPFPQVPWGWYEQLDHRHPLKRVSTGQVALQFVAAAPGSATEYNWFQSLDWPTRARRLNEFPATSIPVYFVPPVPGAGNELNWWPSLNEPVRPRLSIRSAQQQGLTAPSQLITTTLEFAWHQRLNEPVRLKATFGQYPGWTAGNISPVVPQAWSWVDEPRRLKRVPRYDQADSYFPVAVAETITIDKWWEELARPTTLRARPHQQGYTFVAAAPGAGVAYNWFVALDTPPTRLRKLAVRPDAAYGNFTPAPAVTEYNWFAALDMPVRRFRSRQSDAAYGYFFPTPGAGVAYNWFQALDTPTRRDRRRIAVQQFRAYGNFTPVVVAVSYYASTSATSQVFERAILFDHVSLPPTGVVFPQQSVVADINLSVNLHICGFGTEEQTADAFSDEAQQGDTWSDQVEQSDAASIESEQSDASVEQAQSDDDYDEQDECGR